jgi:predicted  nucleic acid-binding Zn-ribbon protein
VKVIKKKKPDLRTPETVESDIATAEENLSRISQLMGSTEVARDANRLIALNEEYQQVESRLRSLYDEWELVTSELAKASR